MISLYPKPMIQRRCLTAPLMLMLLTSGVVEAEQPSRFPTDAGVVDVRDHGAMPDDDRDDTAALNAAIAHAITTSNRYRTPRIVYLPAGTYRLSGPVEGRVPDHAWSGGWRAGVMLIGDGPGHTVLRLADHTPGYDNPEKPKWVVATGSENATRGREKNALKGGGNEAFHHHLEGFTIDVGHGNPGATALDFVASNRGAVIDVHLKAPQNSGYTGLSLERWWPGPCLIRNLTLDGFAFGIRAHHYQYGIAFQNLTLRNQRELVIRNTHNMLAIEGLVSDNLVPFYRSDSSHGMLVLLGAELRGGDPDATAIDGKSRLMLRDVTVSGYRNAFNDRRAKRTIDARRIPFYTSQRLTLGISPRPLGLPIAKPPAFNPPPAAQWVSVTRHGAVPGDDQDDVDAIQAAIDTGAPVIYLPNGHYHLSRPLELRGTTRWVVGMQAHLSPLYKLSTGKPTVRFTGDAEAAIKLQWVHVDGFVEHSGAGTLTLAHSVISCGYRNTAQGTGDAFIEDVIGRPYLINHPQNVWARQLNTEFFDGPLVENHGGTFWVFGWKTEANTEVPLLLQTSGDTEIVGSLFYNTNSRKTLQGPPLLNQGGRLVASFVSNGRGYRDLLGRAYGQRAGAIPGRRAEGRAVSLIGSRVRVDPDQNDTPSP